MPARWSPSPRGRDLWIALTLFLLALLPRSAALDRFVTWDELFWTRAALRFHREIEGQDWAGTYIIGQPGVITLWLGTAALALRSAVAGPEARETILEAGRLRYRDDDLETLATLEGLWRGLPAAVAVFCAAAIALSFWWLRPIWGRGAAGAAGILLALDPFYIAHSRVFALDGVLASLCLLGLIALLRWWGSDRLGWLVAGAALAGMATLNKVPALGLVAWGGLVAFVGGWRQGLPADRSWQTAAKRLCAWILGVVLTIYALWPALWVAPVGTLGRIADRLRIYEGTAYDAMFFAGTRGVAPGMAFYPTVAFFRLSPLVIAGLAALAWLLWRHRRTLPLSSVQVLGGFSLAFTVLLTWPATKFDRYLLPALLPLVALAGLGLAAGMARLPWAARLPQGAQAAILALAAALLLVPVAPAYYLAWYNPLASGVATAERVLPLGWGEGMDQVADYLRQRVAELGDGRPLVVATDGFVSLAGVSGSHLVRAVGENCATADLVVVYVLDRQIGRPVAETYGAMEPSFTAWVNGMPYARVYEGGRTCWPEDG